MTERGDNDTIFSWNLPNKCKQHAKGIVFSSVLNIV